MLSRSLQISVALGLGVLVLWLGLASYATVAKHLQIREQSRELARLESITKTLRTTIEDSRSVPEANRQAEAGPDLVAELADAKAARDRAHTLAEASAGEAAELGRELALAKEQIRELKCDLVEARAERPGADQTASFGGTGGPPAAAGAEVTLAGQVALADPACPPPR